ncbi:hypothetical protein [Burkholderia cenocepacia]|uniref:hypothetical protein n=1 Tax=Burkholderia cenocepacia TaxID=95486 RepID=UPI000A5ED8A6|nr:hypothetical protein [Burkholderia cenocepacia]
MEIRYLGFAPMIHLDVSVHDADHNPERTDALGRLAAVASVGAQVFALPPKSGDH